MVVGHSDEFSRSFSWCETSSENLYPAPLRFTCRPLSSKAPPEPIAPALISDGETPVCEPQDCPGTSPCTVRTPMRWQKRCLA